MTSNITNNFSFVHLHAYSHYSIGNSIAKVKDIVEAAKSFNMSAVCITDLGNMFGTIEFYKEALKNGIKPIIGLEINVNDVSSSKNSHNNLVLIAKNNTGYKNLIKISSEANLSSLGDVPVINQKFLENHSEGLIALSGGLNGAIPSALLKGDRGKAISIINYYQSLFGKDNFYIELQNTGLEEQVKLLPELVSAARECGAPIVATNNCCYIKQEDYEAFEFALALFEKSNKWEKYNPIHTKSIKAVLKRLNISPVAIKESYYKSPAEMKKLFSEFPEAISNSLKIANECNVNITFGEQSYPKFPVPLGKTEESYIREICNAGLIDNYGQNPPKEAVERLEYELDIIKKMGYISAFLIVWEYVDWARKNDIVVGPGRGGYIASSIVAYSMHITDVDPLKFGLCFEGYINSDNKSKPRFNIEFSEEGRLKVIEHLVDFYGSSKAAQIIRFQCIELKNPIKDIGMLMGLNKKKIDSIARMVYFWPDYSRKKYSLRNPEQKEIEYKGNLKEKKLVRIASTLDGVVEHLTCCGVNYVISNNNLNEIIPLTQKKSLKNSETILNISQYKNNEIDELGLFRVNLTSLLGLDFLQNSLKIAEENHLNGDNEHKKKIIYLRNILNLKCRNDNDYLHSEKINSNFNDPFVYDLLRKELTLGIYLLDTNLLKEGIKRLIPKDFNDITALLTIYNPRLYFMADKEYFKAKESGKDFDCLHPALRKVLNDTFGLYFYNEQIIKTGEIIAGFTANQAESFCEGLVEYGYSRGKKDIEAKKEKEKLCNSFIGGAVKNGIDEELAKSIFNYMARFSECCVCKSNSVACAVLAYKMLWVKAHFPAEFFTAYLNSEVNRYCNDLVGEFKEYFVDKKGRERSYNYLDKDLIYKECKELGICCSLPEFITPTTCFKTDGKKIWCEASIR